MQHIGKPWRRVVGLLIYFQNQVSLEGITLYLSAFNKKTQTTTTKTQITNQPKKERKTTPKKPPTQQILCNQISQYFQTEAKAKWNILNPFGKYFNHPSMQNTQYCVAPLPHRISSLFSFSTSDKHHQRQENSPDS